MRLNPRNDKALGMQAELLLQMGDTKKALAGVDESVRLNPKSVHALVLRAAIYVSQGECGRAARGSGQGD